MTKSVIITQSNYLPWKGYFDNIALADELVLYDSVQFTKRDWRNRNKIKTANGLKWLTVPVKVSGRYHQSIDETRIEGQSWAEKHWSTIQHSYGKMPGFDVLRSLFEDIYSDMPFELVSDLNKLLIERVLEFLNVSTIVTTSGDYEITGNPTEKLVNICKQLGATRYCTGPAAKAYLDETVFGKESIEVHYFGNEYHTEYAQPFPPFTHQVSIVDLIACCGDQAGFYMKNVR